MSSSAPLPTVQGTRDHRGVGLDVTASKAANGRGRDVWMSYMFQLGLIASQVLLEVVPSMGGNGVIGLAYSLLWFVTAVFANLALSGLLFAVYAVAIHRAQQTADRAIQSDEGASEGSRRNSKSPREAAAHTSLFKDKGKLLELWSASYSLARLMRTVIWGVLYLYITGLVTRQDASEFWQFDAVPQWYYVIESVFLWMVQIDYAYALLRAPVKAQYIFSLSSILDFCTMPPLYLFIGLMVNQPGNPAFEYNYLIKFGFVRFLRLYSTMPIFKLVFGHLVDEVRLSIVSIVLSVVSVLFFFAGLIYTVEAPTGSFTTYTDFIYYVWVTMSTVGFGDFSPSNPWSRFYSMVCIVMTIGWIPMQINNLVDALGTPKTRFGTAVTEQDNPHVVLIGPISPQQFEAFVSLFYSVPAEAKTKLTLLTPIPVYHYNEDKMRETGHTNNVSVIRGDICGDQPNQILLTKVSKAKRIFVFADDADETKALHLRQADKINILRILGLNKLVPNKSKIFVQMNRATQKLLARDLLNIHQEDFNRVLCINEFKMQLLAKSAAGCRGVVTMISNLTTPKTLSPDQEAGWLHDYITGMQMEIKRFTVGPNLNGKEFKQIASECYHNFNAIFFAVRRDVVDPHSSGAEGHSVMFVNPARMQRFTLHSDPVYPDDRDWAYFLVDTANAYRLSEYMGVFNVDEKQNQDRNVNTMSPQSKSDRKDVLAASDFKTPLADMSGHLKGQLQMTANEDVMIPKDRDLASVQANQHSSAACVLLCGWPVNVVAFLLTFRARGDSSIAVIILAPEVPEYSSLQDLAIFPNVFYVKGDPLARVDLKRAGVFYAQSIVIFKECKGVSSREDILSPVDMVLVDNDDTDVVLVQSKCRAALNESTSPAGTVESYQVGSSDIFVLTELLDQDNMRFVDQSSWWQVDKPSGQWVCCPSFAEGRVFTDSMLHCFLCGTHFMPALLSLVENLVGGVMPDAANVKGTKLDQLDNSCHLIQVPIADRFVGLPIGEELFCELMQEGYIVMGIYRLKNDGRRYVWTAPPATTIMKQDDHLLLLSASPREKRISC